ncbi:hypothetical protein JL721_5142 [Aureococcus anophagefferens]|nr:hypothetical protein JL721_5142 [Aureococcus anophagefferens]
MVSCASVSFAGRVVTDSADGAYSVFAIDVDGDDDVDALSASYSDDTVSWYENDGSQSFTERIITTLADNVLSVFAIDVDGDGDVDALSASYMDDTVAWYENDASEPFTERVITYTADAADSVYAIDVDGDGDADALSASKTDDTVAWYENDGTQSFTERVITTLADGAFSVFAIDVDGDGDVDPLSTSRYDDTVAWYENGDAQSFTERIISTTADFATSVFAIDVDGDGDVDVLSASGSDNTVAWYENDGAHPSRSASWHTGPPRSVYAIDVDGDGDVDALSASADDDTVAWYEDDCETAAHGGAVCRDGRAYGGAVCEYHADDEPRADERCPNAAADDFLHERLIFTAHHQQLGDGRLWRLRVDVDGDGVDDVLSASYSDDTVAWFENDGSQSFTERILTTLAEGARNVFAIDVDGDGDADALSASNGDDTVAWYENDGSQSFAERVITTLADAAQSVFAIDVDGDGDVDALGDVVAIDVDGDGDVDVLSASQLDNTIAWYENDGSQSFTARVVTNAADAAYSVFAIDVDGDGDADALSASADDDTVAWYENDGSQSFAELVIADAADQANTVFAFDVDGDGDIDALSSSYGDDTVSWYENDGSQSFTTRIITTTGAALTVAFDAPTDLGGFAAGEAFGCAALLDMADGDVAQCDWTDAATLNVLVSSALAVVPGVTVALKPGVLKAPCDDAGPTSAAVCEGGFEVSGDQSTGSGGRAFVVRDWNATCVGAGGIAPRSKTRRDPATFAVASATLSSLGCEAVTLTLTLANFLGFSATSAAHAVAVRHDTPPVVTVVGGLRQATARPQALSVTASALATSCDGRAAGTAPSSTTASRRPPPTPRPRYFKLPPFALSVGTHALTLVVRDAQHAASNTSTALSVVVARSAVVAVVDGGDRVVPRRPSSPAAPRARLGDLRRLGRRRRRARRLRRRRAADERRRRRGAESGSRSTLFALETRSWVTADAPLTYAFKAGGATLRAPTLEPQLEGVVLKEGAVVVAVVAYDSLGGSSGAETVVLCAPPAPETLAALAADRLDEAAALGNSEAVAHRRRRGGRRGPEFAVDAPRGHGRRRRRLDDDAALSSRARRPSRRPRRPTAASCSARPPRRRRSTRRRNSRARSRAVGFAETTAESCVVAMSALLDNDDARRRRRLNIEAPAEPSATSPSRRARRRRRRGDRRRRRRRGPVVVSSDRIDVTSAALPLNATPGVPNAEGRRLGQGLRDVDERHGRRVVRVRRAVNRPGDYRVETDAVASSAAYVGSFVSVPDLGRSAAILLALLGLGAVGLVAAGGRVLDRRDAAVPPPSLRSRMLRKQRDDFGASTDQLATSGRATGPASTAPNATATATTEHYFTLALTMALLLPLIAVLDVIFDTYVAAPSPFAHAREKAGEKPEAEKSHRTLDALDEPSFSFVPEGLARPDVDAAVARHCETPKATARKRAKKWTTYFRRRLAAFRRNVGESLGETRSLRHKSAALEETRNIYRHSITSFDEDAAVDVPTKARYVGAIAAEVVLLLYIGFYLVAYGSDMGRGRTIVWLYTVSVSLALYYAVISPLEVLFFGYALPSLLAEHFEKFEDPTSLSRYPFETKLPSVATYFLALWHEELHETRIGRHCLGTLHEEAPDTSPEALKRILADATWRPTLQVRATIFLVSGFVTLPVSWQEVLFEEVFTFTPFAPRS